ncbi:MAG: T9SS type A sorting domain-containing protein [Myroides sp.]
MKLKLLFALLFVTISNAQTQVGQDITVNGNSVDAVALSENGNVLAVSSDSVTQVFSNVSGNWAQVGQDIQQYGYRTLLSNDGSIVAVTDGWNVKVYKNINNNWVQVGQVIQEDAHDIALSGDGSTLVIAPMSNLTFNIYKNISGTWTLIDNISTYFGCFSVCLSENGDTIASSPHPGATIDIFKYVNNKWTQSSTINANPNDVSTGYRMDISSDGNTIAITTMAVQPQNLGSINVYRYISNTWTQIGNPITSQVPNENFGSNVAISGSGNVVIVGTRENGNTGNGRVEIHEYLQGNWVKKGEIIDNNGNSIFWAIALSRDGSSLAVRSNGKVGPKPAGSNEGKGPSSGARVYDISGILSSDTFVLENFNIYPNPTTDILNIELKENLTLEKVLIYNTSGQLVKETSEKIINVSGFAKGIYNVQVLTNHGKATKKVIVK